MEKKVSKTKYLYDHKYFQSSRLFQRKQERLDFLYQTVDEFRPRSILDIGCGIGYFVKYLRKKGLNVQGIDFAESLKSWWGNDYFFRIAEAKDLPFLDKSFDVVFSSDFFEHVPEEEIDQILSEMKRVGKRVVAIIAVETNLSERQRLYHCTNRPLTWWRSKLEGVKVVASNHE